MISSDFLHKVSGQTFQFIAHNITDKQILCQIEKMKFHLD